MIMKNFNIFPNYSKFISHTVAGGGFGYTCIFMSMPTKKAFLKRKPSSKKKCV
jgi:hypothetical protein